MTESEEQEIRNELTTARQRYELAVAEMRLAETVYRDLGGQHPDGSHELIKSSRKLAHESANFQEALKRFSEVVLRGHQEHRPNPEGNKH